MPQDDNANSSDTEQGTSALTADQVVDIVSEVVNKAITNRFKQFEGRMDKTTQELTNKFEERFSSVTAPKSETAPPGADPRLEDNPQYRGLQKQLTDMQQKLEAAERAKYIEMTRARDKELRQRLSDELIRGGVDPSRVRHAVGLLVDSDKRVRYLEDSEDVVFNDLDDQEVDFKTGLRSWLKSDDAKIYLSARGTTGSGDRRTPERSGKSNGSNQEKPDAQDAMNALFDIYRNGGRI